MKLVSQIGVGTIVSFILPQVAQRVAVESSKPTPADGSFRRRVLLVEDQEQVRHVIGLSLRSMGLDVIEAANADDAIRLIQTSAPPHWVLSDVRMPGSMNGIQLRNWVLSHFADIPVILMSGYRDSETELEPEAAFLQKPIKPLELRQAFGM